MVKSVTEDIIYEDRDIIVCHKKAGIAVQTSRTGEPDMESMLKNYLKSAYVGIVHRLDQPVEGILVFAKTKQAAAGLSAQNRDGIITKRYYAVGLPEKEAHCLPEEGKETVLSGYLLKNGKTNTSGIAEKTTKDAKYAELSYEIVKYMPETEGEMLPVLLRIRLKTGRHHQIRVQMADAGIPLFGDGKYGSECSKRFSREKGIKNIALCAYELEFSHPDSGKTMTFTVMPSGEAFTPFFPINPVKEKQ